MTVFCKRDFHSAPDYFGAMLWRPSCKGGINSPEVNDAQLMREKQPTNHYLKTSPIERRAPCAVRLGRLRPSTVRFLKKIGL